MSGNSDNDRIDVLDRRLEENKRLGEKIRLKQEEFKRANPGVGNFIELDEDDEAILDTVWDEERGETVVIENDELGADSDTAPIDPKTDLQFNGRINLFKLISLAMANTDEPLSPDEHDDLMAHYQRAFHVDELPLKYIKWIRRAELRLYDRLEREGKALQDYYFETQYGPVGVPSVDDYES